MHTQRRRGATRRLRRTQRTSGDRRAQARRRKENMVDRSWKPKVVFPTQRSQRFSQGHAKGKLFAVLCEVLSFLCVNQTIARRPPSRAGYCPTAIRVLYRASINCGER